MDFEAYKHILQIAVDNEVESYDFYKSAIEKVKENSSKDMFAELAEEEMKHKMILEGFINNETKPLKFKQVKDYKISETVDSPRLSVEMKFADAIALAMKKEEESMHLYHELASFSMDEKQKNVFLELAKMEQGHKTRLEALYTDAAYAEVW